MIEEIDFDSDNFIKNIEIDANNIYDVAIKHEYENYISWFISELKGAGRIYLSVSSFKSFFLSEFMKAFNA